MFSFRHDVRSDMAEQPGLEGTDATERLVLYELCECERRGETPVAALDLLGRCRERLGELEDVPVGTVSEADVVRACRSLAGDGLVEEVPADETSPTGKGRPDFETAVDGERVRETVRDDDRLPGLPDDEA